MSLLGQPQHILHQRSYSPKHYCVSSAMMLCNSGLVSQHSRQHQRRKSVLTSLCLGITEPFQSHSCGYLSDKERYMVSEVVICMNL